MTDNGPDECNGGLIFVFVRVASGEIRLLQLSDSGSGHVINSTCDVLLADASMVVCTTGIISRHDSIHLHFGHDKLWERGSEFVWTSEYAKSKAVLHYCV